MEDALLYLGPVSASAAFLGTKLIRSLRLEKNNSVAPSSLQRTILATGAVGLMCTHAARIVVFIKNAEDLSPTSTVQDIVPSDLASILVCICLSSSLLEDLIPNWHAFCWAWHAFLAVEATSSLTGQMQQQPSSPDHVEQLNRTLRSFRLACVCLICTTTFWCSRGWLLEFHGRNFSTTWKSAKPAPCEETLDQDDSAYSESEELENGAELKAQRKKRMRGAGDWFAYLAEYKIFLPMLLPLHDRKVQVCLALSLLQLLAARVTGLLVPRQLGIITDELAAIAHSGAGNVPWRAISVWVALSLAKSHAVEGVLQRWLYLPVTQHTYRSLCSTMFRHIMNMSMDFHHNHDSGELSRTLELGRGLQDMLEFLSFTLGPMVADVIMIFVSVPQLFDPYMALIGLASGLLYSWSGNQVARLGRQQRRRYVAAKEEHQRIEFDSLSNWQISSQFNRTDYEVARYEAQIESLQKAERAQTLVSSLNTGLEDLIMTTARLLVVALAMYRVSQGTIAIGGLVSFMSYWQTIETPLTHFSWMIRKLDSMLTESERLLQLLQTKSTIVEEPGAEPLRISSGKVAFEHINFAYDTRKLTVKDMSFVAEPGTVCALVGETGGGKTTALRLLFRYYDVASGTIRIDGQDIRKVTLNSLRDSFGMVTQDPTLFNTTIMSNLRYARLDATDEEIMEACKGAAIHDKIMQFPDKYQSKVGERGVKLSGGELQRIAIARAILRDPKIVLLDEATSQIDAETEAEIQKALKRLMTGRTTFVIAHRLSTIQKADQILVIQDGTVVEKGTHRELNEVGGKYAALWARQTSRDILDNT